MDAKSIMRTAPAVVILAIARIHRYSFIYN